nr:MAG TPA: hypothetical protein [Caudoviricetes sp.]
MLVYWTVRGRVRGFVRGLSAPRLDKARRSAIMSIEKGAATSG